MMNQRVKVFVCCSMRKMKFIEGESREGKVSQQRVIYTQKIEQTLELNMHKVINRSFLECRRKYPRK